MIHESANLDVVVEVVTVNGTGVASGVTYNVRPIEGRQRGTLVGLTPERWFPSSVILDPPVPVGRLGRVQSIGGTVVLKLTEHPRATEC